MDYAQFSTAVFEALEAGDEALLAKVVSQTDEYGISVECLKDTLSEALVEAASQNLVAAVSILLSAGADVHYERDEALEKACYYGYKDVAEKLIAAGADVHARGDEFFVKAAHWGACAILPILIAAGEDIHMNFDVALRTAFTFWDIELLQVVLPYYKDPVRDVPILEAYYAKAKPNIPDEIRKEVEQYIEAHIQGLKEKLAPGAVAISIPEPFLEMAEPPQRLDLA